MKTSTTGLSPREARAFRREFLIAVLVGWFGAVAAMAQAPTTYEIVHAFRASGQPASGDAPSVSSLLLAPDGYFYGTTYWGGSSGVGTIFRMDSAGNLTTLHSFAYADGANPAAGLVRGTDGSFYGTTTRGGGNNQGIVFRMDAGGTVTRLYSFDGVNGKNPRAALIEAADGNLYGTAESGGTNGDGTVFRVSTNGTLTILHSFSTWVDGAHPLTELREGADGNLYGTTSVGGTVFRITSTGDFAVLHSFGINTSVSSLIQTGSGALLGTTKAADNGAGPSTIVRIELAGDAAVLHQFDPSTEGYLPVAGLVEGSDGAFFGSTSSGAETCPYGAVYRVDGSGNVSVLHAFTGEDGARPRVAMVLNNDGLLYGATTSTRGWPDTASIAGTVFRVDIGGSFTTVHRFGWSDGAEPGKLTQATDGSLYGTTNTGGAYDLGTIYRLDSLDVVTSLHTFSDSDGTHPRAALVQATDGKLYGTTESGGAGGWGTIYRIGYDGAVTTLHSFDGNDGGSSSGLIQASDGKFYGVTPGGLGSAQWGTAFRMDSSGNFATIASFNPEMDGASPNGPLIAANEKFYGTTSQGGAYGMGIVFRLSMDGDVWPQYSFGGLDGATPMAGLTYVDGDLWGTTYYGGDPGPGTAFKTIPDSYALDTKHAFNGVDGANPTELFWAGSQGKFYGTFSGPTGTVFTMDYDGNVTSLPGAYASGFMQAADGFIYGSGASPLGGGGIIRFADRPLAVNEVSPSSGAASGGAALVVLGGGFSSGAIVTVGVTAGTDVTVSDSTFLYLFTPALSPGTLNDVSVANTGSSLATATRPKAFFADFLDVPQLDPFHDFVEKIFRAGITAGCGNGSYCGGDAVTRAQMAAFLLKAEHGSGYAPPHCNGFFADVPCPSLFADWIEQLAREGITAGCGGRNYCPSTPVTRAQMAVFLLKAEHGSAYAPPSCTGVFGDVSCPSLFADWIEQLAAEGITSGCGGGDYCPANPNTRGQMAVFLTKTFHL